ncbi:type I restriction-modification system subunit M [Mesosutterella multiformis]|jgi:type I restriction enzyme M protein|uniref:site-specific DNA-methyltransferase (adenine-specific) n=1 Tax=Mesosutterella multiformis TaxID=2259133 RepID=A0A388SEQ0_9BURK|nr:type I restriction-modification system subunit M [Mesosutterella multiformis]GBO94655.1 type I restriction-modification system subunit M [Mesosutterella multiformis]GCB31111.1 type I restriction-modification system subunit M [Mesosutterella multiformis]
MNKQALAAKIWESANRMRSKIEANEYKDYILGFIFYKFLSDNEVRYLKSIDWTDEFLPEVTEEDKETVTNVQQNLGYFISYDNLFSTWLKKGADFSVSNVTDALAAFNRLINPYHKRVYDKIFNTLETGLSKLGENTGAQSKAIRSLIDLIKDIPMDGKQDYDVLGFIYEYLISNFAANAGKKAGEFYTPHEVSLLMSEIIARHLKDRDHIEIYDPTSGSGSLLINIGHCASKYIGKDNCVKYYAQELKQNTYNLTRMNLIMRGILAANIVTRNGDTLEEDWPYFEDEDHDATYKRLYVDAVVSNPPYSQVWDPTGKETDTRFAGYGLAPKSKADYAFLLHDLYHLKSDGIMAIVLPHGVLFRGGEEGTIRKNLIDQNNIDTIIGLPANIFFGTGIPTIIMILRKNRVNDDVLIIDASKGFEKEGKSNKLRACDIKKIVDTVAARQTVDNFSKVVSRQEIRDNDYNLNIPRYVDTSEKPENWDIYASMFGGIPADELNAFQKYWDAFPALKTSLFTTENGAYYQPSASDLHSALLKDPDVQDWQKQYQGILQSFDSFLSKELIDQMMSVPLAKEEDVLSAELFHSMKGLPILDPYQSYQYLDTAWRKISQDLEVIQTEGQDIIRQVDVLTETKSKGGKSSFEWGGRVLPFDLVQNALLTDEVKALQEGEDRLQEIGSSLESLLDDLDEDVKEGADFLNDAKDSFVAPAVDKTLKAKAASDETLSILKNVKKLFTEEKALKKDLKKGKEDLEAKTKEVIEHLSEDEAKALVKQKWVDALLKELAQQQTDQLEDFGKKLEALTEKYSITLSDLGEEIQQTEKELQGMLDDLTGSEFDEKGIAEFKKLLGEA